MVFFNCNACGEALKKSAVEKHYLTKCRQCEVLSCVDCGKDFWGEDYQKHVKCISEEEKYSGKDFKPRASANKGEKKQELWIQQVQEAIQTASGNSTLRNTLQKLVDFPNIPRKQAKFENFLKNSLRIHNPTLTKQVWEAMKASMSKPEVPEPEVASAKPETNSANGNIEQSNNDDPKSSKEKKKSQREKAASGNSVETETLEEPGKKSKRERKEERREKSKKKEKKEKNVDNGDKKKKRKLDEVDDDDVIESKKSKKQKSVPEEEPVELEEQKNGDDEIVSNAMTPTKFNWESVIIRVLKTQDDKEISVKKLKKKVMNEYFSLVAEKNRMSEENLWAKFDKKVNKNGRFKVHKERVKLVS